jgi:hypothetical protein
MREVNPTPFFYVLDADAKKSLKRQPIGDLELHLITGQHLQFAKHQNIEHQHGAAERSSVFFGLRRPRPACSGSRKIDHDTTFPSTTSGSPSAPSFR